MSEYTEAQLEEIIQKAVMKALSQNTGVAPHPGCPLSGDDVMFFHRLKSSVDRTASWLGHGVLLFLLAGIAYLIKLGLEAYTRGAFPK